MNFGQLQMSRGLTSSLRCGQALCASSREVDGADEKRVLKIDNPESHASAMGREGRSQGGIGAGQVGVRYF
jgi:hypothetical protein